MTSENLGVLHSDSISFKWLFAFVILGNVTMKSLQDLYVMTDEIEGIILSLVGHTRIFFKFKMQDQDTVVLLKIRLNTLD